MLKRVPSGIPGLDKLMQGGFVDRSVILVTGETGTGKTIFGCQFIVAGAEQGEPGLYISLEESPEEIRSDMASFGMDMEKYEKKKMLKIIYHDPVQLNNIDSVIIGEVNSMKAKRVVIDSTALLALNIENPAQIRRRVFSVINTIKRNSCTAVIISEIPEGSKAISRFGVEEFAADGVIILHYLGIGEISARSLTIRKMRRTKHGNDVYPLEINDNGIIVRKVEV